MTYALKEALHRLAIAKRRYDDAAAAKPPKGLEEAYGRNLYAACERLLMEVNSVNAQFGHHLEVEQAESEAAR